MDNTKYTPTVLSLCSGYGGIEKGLERVFGGISVLAHVEIEAFAIANLVNKMETGQMAPAPIWTNLKTFRPGIFRDRIDILTGGYPCQPFSAAGKRGGESDPRHLWPCVHAAIYVARPRLVFLENVEGHLSKGIVQVLADLEEMAYRPVVGVFSASEVGASHQRKRVFILAHSVSEGLQGHTGYEQDQTGQIRSWKNRPARPGEPQYEWEELGDSEHYGLYGSAVPRCAETSSRDNPERKNTTSKPTGANRPGVLRDLWPARPGEPQYEWEEPRVVGHAKADNKRRGLQPEGYREGIEDRRPSRIGRSKTQSGVGGAAHGITDRVDRLRLLGNGVVPQTAEKAFKTLYEELICAN